MYDTDSNGCAARTEKNMMILANAGWVFCKTTGSQREGWAKAEYGKYSPRFSFGEALQVAFADAIREFCQ